VATFTALQEGVIVSGDSAYGDALVAEWRLLVKRYLVLLTGGD
jgi:hypothetical protein